MTDKKRLRIEDILKPGAKLEARKLTKKDLKKYEKRFEQLRREEEARRQIDWESLNKPMTI